MDIDLNGKFGTLNLDQLASPDMVVMIVAWVYLVTNIGRVFFYLPQIQAAMRCGNGAMAVSKLTWGSFALSHLAAMVYGSVILHDTLFTAVSLLNFLCAFIIFLLVLIKQIKHKQNHS